MDKRFEVRYFDGELSSFYVIAKDKDEAYELFEKRFKNIYHVFEDIYLYKEPEFFTRENILK